MTSGTFDDGRLLVLLGLAAVVGTGAVATRIGASRRGSHVHPAQPPQPWFAWPRVDPELVKRHVNKTCPHVGTGRDARRVVTPHVTSSYTWFGPGLLDLDHPWFRPVHPYSDRDVDRYAARIRKGSPPPAVVILVDNEYSGEDRFFVEDGSHRVAAARLAGQSQILAFIGVDPEEVKKRARPLPRAPLVGPPHSPLPSPSGPKARDGRTDPFTDVVATAGVRIGPSTIHGHGLFATRALRKGQVVGPGLLRVATDGEEEDLKQTLITQFVNHAVPANVHFRVSITRGITYDLVTTAAVRKGDELVADYDAYTVFVEETAKLACAGDPAHGAVRTRAGSQVRVGPRLSGSTHGRQWAKAKAAILDAILRSSTRDISKWWPVQERVLYVGGSEYDPEAWTYEDWLKDALTGTEVMREPGQRWSGEPGARWESSAVRVREKKRDPRGGETKVSELTATDPDHAAEWITDRIASREGWSPWRFGLGQRVMTTRHHRGVDTRSQAGQEEGKSGAGRTEATVATRRHARIRETLQEISSWGAWRLWFQPEDAPVIGGAVRSLVELGSFKDFELACDRAKEDERERR